MNNRILVVDDDKQNLVLIKSALEENYTVQICQNGQEALDIIPDFSPDVILLDWQMPVLDGLQTLKAIKSDDATKNIMIIMMTGYMTDQSDLLLAYNEGVADFIRKPFDLLELKVRVNSVVQLVESYKCVIMQKDRELVTSSMQLLENSHLVNSIVDEFETLLSEKCDSVVLLDKLSDFKARLCSKASDAQWKQFNISFQNVNPDFRSNLLKTHPELTPAEIKLSTLIKLNLSTKEISSITYSTVNSIKVARARLRKKLDIDSENNLAGYLMRF